MEIGLATLRRDGFGYLSRKVDGSAAHFETAPFQSTESSSVFVNAEGVSKEAPLTVELIDEFAQPVGVTARVTESGTRVKVPFAKPVAAGEAFGLRVSLPDSGNAKIYALYVRED